MSYDEHQAMWPQMIAALASIDVALGLPEDGCNSTAQTLARIRDLRAELEALRKDAERYRWLRDKSPPTWEMTAQGLPLFKFDFDAAIDAEMEST